jgi:hypothetical protein
MTDVLEDVCVYGSDGAQADEENVDGGVAIGSHDVCIFTEGLAIDLGVRVTGDIGGLDVLHYGQGLQTL